MLRWKRAWRTDTVKAKSQSCRQLDRLYGMSWSDTLFDMLKVFNSSVVVGMHPDQAAQVRSDIFCYHVRQTCQAIIEFALANNKPFACIPCCVYSNQPQVCVLLLLTRALNFKLAVSVAEARRWPSGPRLRKPRGVSLEHGGGHPSRNAAIRG